MSRDEVRALRAVKDPASRAQRATELLKSYQADVTELSRIRREAFDDLRRRGLSQTEVARLVGLSRGRIGQLATSGPAPERLFLGDDDLTAVVARKDESGRPMIAAETMTAVSRLQSLAAALGLPITIEPVPPATAVDLNRDNLLILGGPRVLPVVTDLMGHDPFITFEEDPEGRWYLRDNASGQDYRSPQDAGEARDFGYLARLPRPAANGSVLVAAGIHPIGLQGVVAMLETDLPDLYAVVGVAPFSMIVECRYDPVTLMVTDTRHVVPPRLHP